MSERLTRLRALMAQQDLEALLITQPENRRYLSGFSGSSGVLIITSNCALLATDFRYYEQVRQQAPAFALVEVSGQMSATVAAQVEALGIRRLGFESHDVTVELYEQWREAMPQVTWVPTRDLVESLRRVKDAEEVAAIEAAVRIADDAMTYIMEWMHPGVTEREVAWALEAHMRTHGAERLSFTPIVAAGPHGAMAHAELSERPIQAGEPIVVDIGAVYHGYCSDLTRSFCLGWASETYLAIWDTVLAAQLAAERAIKAGMSGIEADAIARQIIADAGYADAFGHGLGHGVGLAIHEAPRASRLSADTLQAGEVLTVEPGVYLPEWGGVRIEDLVVIGEDGCRVLTRAPKTAVIGR